MNIKPVLLLALVLALFMRGWQAKERFYYAHDNDLAGWIVKDIVVDGHLRLIGQQTSAVGIFIGPLFYYSLIPFYLLANMDPAGSLMYSILIGLAAVASIYYVVNKVFGSSSAGFAALLYAGSELIAKTEREVVPTTGVMLWSIWFFYAVFLVFKGQKSGLLLAAVLLSLVWHLNLALVLLSPLILLGIFYSKMYNLKFFVAPLIVFLVLSAPLFSFETRHNFIQSRALQNSIFSLADSSETAVFLSQKISHVVVYAQKNITHIFLTQGFDFSLSLLPVILVALFIRLITKKLIPSYFAPVFIGWMFLFVIFFALHPINLSEYYLNGMNIFWVIIASVSLAKLFPKYLAWVLTGLFVLLNLSYFISSPINANGYIQKKALVDYISRDAASHNYPCISVSYITDPGYNLGYRYFFFLKNLHVNQPSSGSPVYSIVFPHQIVDKIDKSFGALGLVLPDYSRYDQDMVIDSCSGQNSNLTDPMFGFTK
jgi:4-amino-4-deoxy-L-arabinose transferase-like glycosyltransferase